ncbi:MAG: hypothetical protein Q7T92_12140, partial [Lutibacter sp.]|nr:hypothetical protein [Lutibacter sp.]
FYLAEKANQKRISAAVPNAVEIKNKVKRYQKAFLAHFFFRRLLVLIFEIWTHLSPFFTENDFSEIKSI